MPPELYEEACFLDDLEDMTDDSECVSSIITEMQAMRFVFEACFKGGSRDIALDSVYKALRVRSSSPSSFEGKLTTFCLAWLVGEDRSSLLPQTSDHKNWSRKMFESLIIDWVSWLRTGSKDVLVTIEKMYASERPEGGNAVETWSLNFWAKALEMLVLGHPDEAQRFFERANEVGSQFGIPTNPSICWTYAVSFFPKS
jgi:hypothetical protein